jgi:CubicO group peptidase (beta-lactamase class C family)
VDGVCKTLLKLQQETDLIDLVKRGLVNHPHRFIFGWDRVENPKETLAGNGCSANTFGHLGFTGTSVWIDADKLMGHVILSNATRDGWYRKDGLNEIRRAIGSLVWSG